MAQLVGSNVSIHDVLTFLSNLDGLPDTSCHSFQLPADNFCFVPVNDVVFCVDMIGNSRFILFCLRLPLSAPGVFTPFLLFNFFLMLLYTDSKTSTCFSKEKSGRHE